MKIMLPLSVTRISHSYDQNRSWKNLFVWIVSCIVISSFGCGQSKDITLTTADLPCFRDFSNYGHIDISSRNINVYVLDNTNYLIGSNGHPTNTMGLSSKICKVTTLLNEKPRIIIRARAEAPFGDVWRVVGLGATNVNGFLLAVRIRDSAKQKRLWSINFLRFSRSLDREDFIMFNISSLTNVSSNTLTIVCKEDAVYVDQKKYSIEQLRSWFAWLKRQNSPSLKVLILVEDDCPYQKVIRVLEGCYENNIKVGLGFNPESTKKNRLILDIRLIGN